MIRRLVGLQFGLMLLGFGLALLIKSNLGADPWSVFHVGAARRLGLSLGTVVLLTGVLFMFLSWAFLRQPVGIGSICNMILVGPWIDVFLPYLPTWPWWWISLLQVGVSIMVLGMATAFYISARWGAGPRDSFVIGIASRSGLNIKSVRFSVELFALVSGYYLGGPVGIGTLIFALGIGPAMQFFLQRLRMKSWSAMEDS